MGINYIEKGLGLHEAIRAAGHHLHQHDGVWVSSNDTVVQAIMDGFTLGLACTPIISAIKLIARDKILAFLPDWKQSNYNARMNELNEIRFGRALTQDEEKEVAVMRLAWAKAKAIRAASNAHEAAILALTSFEDIGKYSIETGWGD